MIQTVLLVFYLLTTPTDKVICSLWVSAPPSGNDIQAACGPVDLDDLSLRVVSLHDGQIVSEGVPGTEVYDILYHVPPVGNLDDYLIELYRPDHSEIVCTIRTPEYQPTPDELGAECGPDILDRWYAGDVYFQPMGTVTETITIDHCDVIPVATGSGLFRPVVTVSDLATSEPYALLAGRLIWWGYAEGDCSDGWSGIDPTSGAANVCGLAGALPDVITWQNQYDRQILEAANENNIPPVLMKAIIGVESQFWPVWTTPDHETGVAQVTADGLDIPLRYDTDLAYEYCIQLIWDCSPGYTRLTTAQRAQIRDLFYTRLGCWECGPEPARLRTYELIPTLAKIIRSYYCYTQAATGETDPVNLWTLTLAAYHAGGECIAAGDLCPLGQAYVRRIVLESNSDDT